ncbi:MAG: zinc-ribbon domain-containing protein [Treponema sp.]|nr:zinc-ribbon domain-containing protein [Treponema sp.]
MAFCEQCGTKLNEDAKFCSNCGAGIQAGGKSATNAGQSELTIENKPTEVIYSGDGIFIGTMPLMIKLALRAIQEFGWLIGQANDATGIVTFQTKISWGSLNGISCSLFIEEIEKNKFKIRGTAKHNLHKQLIALNIGHEAESKVNKAILKMIELAKK